MGGQKSSWTSTIMRAGLKTGSAIVVVVVVVDCGDGGVLAGLLVVTRMLMRRRCVAGRGSLDGRLEQNQL